MSSSHARGFNLFRYPPNEDVIVERIGPVPTREDFEKEVEANCYS